MERTLFPLDRFFNIIRQLHLLILSNSSGEAFSIVITGTKEASSNLQPQSFRSRVLSISVVQVSGFIDLEDEAIFIHFEYLRSVIMNLSFFHSKSLQILFYPGFTNCLCSFVFLQEYMGFLSCCFKFLQKF